MTEPLNPLDAYAKALDAYAKAAEDAAYAVTKYIAVTGPAQFRALLQRMNEVVRNAPDDVDVQRWVDLRAQLLNDFADVIAEGFAS